MTFPARRGRPRKFTRPARAVTLTLPEDVIATLSRFDPDVGRAIVRLALPLRGVAAPTGVEVATFGSRAVIVVSPTAVLTGLPGVELVPLADGRAIIALDDGMSEEQFELVVRDGLDAGDLEAGDREILAGLAAILRDPRHAGSLTVRRIIVLRAKASARGAGTSPAPTRRR
jgi:hypothetical protein